MLLSFTLVGFRVAHAQEAASGALPTPPPLLSPFLPSPELRPLFSTLNTHSVSLDSEGKPKILRGMDPYEKLPELARNGITDVLVFKPVGKTGAETEEFKAKVRASGVPNVHVFEMPWKDIYKPSEACIHVVRALKYIKEVDESPDRKMFAHCTVGEDRTGILMGLYRMVKEGWTKEKAFQDEMCRWGYERGNPKKPVKKVVCEIREGLTPLYLRLARAVEYNQLTWNSLSNPHIDAKICWNIHKLNKYIGKFKCQTSGEELDPAQTTPDAIEEPCDSDVFGSASLSF